jgi:hypothetical protein
MKTWIVEDTELGRLTVCDHDVMDADQAIFFARQLEHLKARSYDVKYAELKFRMLFPISNEARPGCTRITYHVYDKVGMAKLISAYAKDLPRVDIAGKEVSSPVRVGGAAVGYTLQEVRAAAKTGDPLDARRMSAATRAHEQLMHSIAWYGDDTAGLVGLFNNANLPIGTVVDGVSTDPEWSTKTPDEILFDLNSIVNDIYTDSKLIERANALMLPPAQYTYIASTPRSSVSDTTILAYFLANNPFIKTVEAVNEMAGAGTAGADVMCAYTKDPEKLTYEIPMEVIFHPEQRKGLEIEIPSECSIGGLIVYYPMSIRLREGI